MYAAVLEGPGKIVYKQVDTPNFLKPDELLIKVKSVGLCGSDMHKFNAKSFDGLGLSTNILGHEISGIVENVGENLKSYKPIGDKVAVTPIIACYQCKPCKEDNVQFCENGGSIGRTLPGGFAEYVVAPSSNVVPINKKNVTFDVLSLADPIGVALHTLLMYRTTVFGTNHSGDTPIAIIGDGTVGLTTAFAAKYGFSYRDITVYGKHKKNLQIAEQLGAKAEYFPNGSLPQNLRNSKQLVFETVGRNQSATLEAAIEMAGVRGRIIVSGVYDPEFFGQIYFREMFKKELLVMGANSYTTFNMDSLDESTKFILREIKRGNGFHNYQVRTGLEHGSEFEYAIDLINHNIKLLDKIITHRLPLKDIHKAIDLMNHKNERGVVKVVLHP